MECTAVWEQLYRKRLWGKEGRNESLFRNMKFLQQEEILTSSYLAMLPKQLLLHPTSKSLLGSISNESLGIGSG